jgi:hypothetical protein
MAIRVPDQISSKASNGEKRVFELLRRLPNGLHRLLRAKNRPTSS